MRPGTLASECFWGFCWWMYLRVLLDTVITIIYWMQWSSNTKKPLRKCNTSIWYSKFCPSNKEPGATPQGVSKTMARAKILLGIWATSFECKTAVIEETFGPSAEIVAPKQMLKQKMSPFCNPVRPFQGFKINSLFTLFSMTSTQILICLLFIFHGEKGRSHLRDKPS